MNERNEQENDHLADALNRLGDDDPEQTDAGRDGDFVIGEDPAEEDATIDDDPPQADEEIVEVEAEAVVEDDDDEADDAEAVVVAEDAVVEVEGTAAEVESSGPAETGNAEALAARSAAVRRSSRARAGRASTSATNDLKKVAVPMLITVGLLLMIPGLWALLVLGGVEIFGSAKQGARGMAMVMLLCWPIALLLIFGAFYFIVELRRAEANKRR